MGQSTGLPHRVPQPWQTFGGFQPLSKIEAVRPRCVHVVFASRAGPHPEDVVPGQFRTLASSPLETEKKKKFFFVGARSIAAGESFASLSTKPPPALCHRT